MSFLRPPTPEEVVEFGQHDVLTLVMECDCMQEALTAEWMIEQGLMPDPTEFTEDKFMRVVGVHQCWYWEDKTR